MQHKIKSLGGAAFLMLLISMLMIPCKVISQEELIQEDSIAIDFMNIPPSQVYRETFLPVVTLGDSTKILDQFRESIENVLRSRYVSDSEHAIAIYSLDKNEYYFKKNIDRPLTPASTNKLVTTFAALNLLGHEHRIQTKIITDAVSIEDSILNGDLYIIGNGDAMFSVRDLECMAEDISRLGIKVINGNIYGDGSFFDGVTSRWKYSGDNDEVQAMPPVTALSIEDNKATIVVSSGNKAGAYVNVNVIPQSDSFAKWVTAKVRGYKRKSSLMINEQDAPLYGLNSPYYEHYLYEKAGDSYADIMPIANWRSIRVSSKISTETGKQLFSVSGYLYPNKTVSYRHYMEEPELAVAGALKSRLEAGGITVNGEIGTKALSKGTDPENAYILSSFGRKLTDIIEATNKNSNNYYAENLFKLIGAYEKKHKYNVDGARELIAKQMQKNSIPFKKCIVNDGSGLSRRNLLTAETLIEILKTAENSGMRDAFRNSLSIAGVDGTLKKRMKFTGAENNLIGKTGTLRNVSALSGYVTTLEGERLCFAFLFRGYGVSSYKNAEDELGKIMSELFYYANDIEAYKNN